MGTIYFSADNGQSKGIVGRANTAMGNCLGILHTNNGGHWASTVSNPTEANPHYLTQTYTGSTFNPWNIVALFLPPEVGYNEPATMKYRIWNHSKDMWIATKPRATFFNAKVFGQDEIDLSDYSGTWSDDEDELWLYPNWTAKTYTITYNVTGGTPSMASQIKYYGSSIKVWTTKPSKSGYVFKNWNTKANGTGTSYAPGATITYNGNLTLYAQWTAKPIVTLSFDSNDGGGITHLQAVISGEAAMLDNIGIGRSTQHKTVTVTFNKVNSAATISKTSDTITVATRYTLKCWNTKANGTGTNYYSGQTITITKDTTLYAVWTSTVTASSVTLPTGSLLQYTLLGWSTSKTDKKLVSSPYSSTKNITLYAVWVSNNASLLQFSIETDEDPISMFEIGSKYRIIGFKNGDNDKEYTLTDITTSPYYDEPMSIDDDPDAMEDPELLGYDVTMQFSEDFEDTDVQNASLYPLKIYGAGSWVPDMDYICALNNRLWGCSNEERTIYASALGMPDDFETLDGAATDYFAVAVGTPGPFTGCCAMNNNVLFFKEHTIHKIMGSFPAEYSLYTYDIYGTSESNGLSAINANGTVIYVSEGGISTYTGSSGGKLSSDLGAGNMYDAVAGYNGEKYILHFTDGNGDPKTYSFDTRYGMWIEKDYGKVMGFAHLQEHEYVLVDQDGTNAVYMIDSGNPLADDWMITFKPYLQLDSFNKKRYQHLLFRMELPLGSTIQAEIKSDNGRWIPVARAAGKKDRAMDFVVRTPRTDKIQLRLTGEGPMAILAMQRIYTEGSRR